MKSLIINKTKSRIPKTFIASWNDSVVLKLKSRKVRFSKSATELVVVVVSKSEMRTLNSDYRGKDYATDVLSFVSQEPNSLGELVICADVLKKQAKEHGLTFQQELGYMLLHGILHLLGFDHESDEKEAKRMFKLQDDVFEELCHSSKHVTTSREHRSKKKVRVRTRAL